MTEISNQTMPNLEPHYTSDTKIKKATLTPAIPPANIPKQSVYTDAEANKKLNTLSADIYDSSKKYERPEKKHKKILGLF